MGKQATLTRHAISPPAFEGGKLHRERLVDALHANIPRRLIAVIAPAGYGKTTLLADFASHTELPVCWLKLTEGDRDPMRMAGVLQASLTSRFRRLRRTLRVAAMAGADEAAVAMAFAHAIRNAVEEPFVLIVDDVHLVNDSPSVMGFWKAFLENQPEQVTLVMAGREVPNLPLEALLERGQVAGVGPLELALTPGELRELSRQAFGKDIGEEDLERLQRETGGWVMGVLLSGAVPVSGLGVLVQSQRPMVYDYLAAVVLNRQPRALREFLLQSAVLPVMTAEACDEVLQRTDSGRVLLQAMRGGMFLSSTGERPKTYEYHPQFREFLLATLLEEDPSQLRRLRVRAGRFLARQGSIEAAVDLYLEAGDTRRAGRLAEKHARAIRRAGKLETLERWRGRLKGEERAYVALGIHFAIGLIDRAKTAQARPLLTHSARKAEQHGWRSYSAMASVGLAAAAWHSDKFRMALRHARRAVQHSSQQADHLVKADALRWLANCLITAAPSSKEPLALVNRALRLIESRLDPYPAAVILADKFRIAEEVGAAGGILEAVSALRLLAGSGELQWLRPFVLRHLVYADLCEGKYSDALRRVDSLTEQSSPTVNPREFIYASAIRAYLLGLVGQTEDSLSALAEARPLLDGVQANLTKWAIPWTHLVILRWNGRRTEGRLEARRLIGPGWNNPPVWARSELIAADEGEEPNNRAAKLRAHYKACHRKIARSERVRTLWLLARAYDEQGDQSKASLTFGRAIEEASTPYSATTLAEEGYRDQARFRRLLAAYPDKTKAPDVLLHMRWIRTFDAGLRGRPVEVTSTGILKIRAFSPTTEIHYAGRKVHLRPLDRELLVFIATKRQVRSDVLAGEFWRERARGAQAANIHSAIYRIRNGLGSAAIITSDEGYGLSDSIDVDFDLFSFNDGISRIRRPNAVEDHGLRELAQRTLQSYESGFMTSTQSDWAHRLRAEVEADFLWLTEWYARKNIERSDFEEAMKAIDKGLAAAPCSEALNVVALEILARAGKLRELGTAYQRYVTRLRDDLGLDPPRAVREKYSELLMAAAN